MKVLAISGSLRGGSHNTMLSKGPTGSTNNPGGLHQRHGSHGKVSNPIRQNLGPSGSHGRSQGNIGRIPQLRSLSMPKTQSFQGLSGGRISGHGFGRR